MNRDMNITTIIMRLRNTKWWHVYNLYTMGKSQGRDKVLIQNFGNKNVRKKACAKYRHSGSARVKYTLKIWYQAVGLIHLALNRTHYQDLVITVKNARIPVEGREFIDTSTE